MNFGNALVALNNGHMVARGGWNGKGMFIYKTVGNTVSKDFIAKFASLPSAVKTFLAGRDQDVVFQDSLTMFCADGTMQPGWLASQRDMQAEDWELFSGEVVVTTDQYRKKPVVIKAALTSLAIANASSNWKGLPDWLSEAYEAGIVVFGNDHISIKTLEGTMRAEPDDMIIQGVNGELYPCKPDIFAKTYDRA